MNQVLFFIAMLCLARAELVFRIASNFDGFSIDRKGTTDPKLVQGEDSRACTSTSLAVADGTSRSKISSRPIADVLVSEANLFQVSLKNSDSDPLSPERFQKELLKQINRRLADFCFLEYFYHKKVLEELPNPNPRWSLSDMRTGSTLVAAYLSPSKKTDNLLVVQKGDSQALVFRPLENPDTGSFAYFLVLATRPQRKNWKSLHFVSNENKESLKNEPALSFTALPGDIVLLGSDGLFDNVHLGVLTFCVNYFANRVVKDLGSSEKDDASGSSLFASEISAELVAKLGQKFLKEKESVLEAVKAGYMQPPSNQQKTNTNQQKLKPRRYSTLPFGFNFAQKHVELKGERPTEPKRAFDGSVNLSSHKGIKDSLIRRLSEIGASEPNPPEQEPLSDIPKIEDPPQPEEIPLLDSQENPDKLPEANENVVETEATESVPNPIEVPEDPELPLLIEKPANPPKEVSEPNKPLQEEVEILIQTVQAKDLIWQSFGLRSDTSPLISVPLETFIADKFRLDAASLSKFVNKFDNNLLGESLVRLAQGFVEQGGFYPSPIGLQVLQKDRNPKYLKAKVQDITVLLAMVVDTESNPELLMVKNAGNTLEELDSLQKRALNNLEKQIYAAMTPRNHLKGENYRKNTLI